MNSTYHIIAYLSEPIIGRMLCIAHEMLASEGLLFLVVSHPHKSHLIELKILVIVAPASLPVRREFTLSDFRTLKASYECHWFRRDTRTLEEGWKNGLLALSQG